MPMNKKGNKSRTTIYKKYQAMIKAKTDKAIKGVGNMIMVYLFNDINLSGWLNFVSLGKLFAISIVSKQYFICFAI